MSKAFNRNWEEALNYWGEHEPDCESAYSRGWKNGKEEIINHLLNYLDEDGIVCLSEAQIEDLKKL